VNSNSGTDGITEDDIAGYLANTPGFFERHAELLATVQLASPHGTRAVSLQERQMDMLRERIKNLERKIMEMIRYGQDNMGIADRLHRWTRAVMLTHDIEKLAPVLVHDLQHQFMIPQAAVRVWGVAPALAHLPCAADVSDDVKIFATSLVAAVARADPAAPGPPAHGLRHAGARLARSHALHAGHGHRVPGPGGRYRRRGPHAPARPGLRPWRRRPSSATWNTCAWSAACRRTRSPPTATRWRGW